MSTNSVRRLFTETQHRVAAGSSEAKGCSCSWAGSYSVAKGLNPPITMLAKMVKENEGQQPHHVSSSQSSWDFPGSQKR